MWGLVQWASSYWWSSERSHKRLNRILWGWHGGWFWQWDEVGLGSSGNMLLCWWLLSMVHLSGCECVLVYFLKSLTGLPNVHWVEDSWVFGPVVLGYWRMACSHQYLGCCGSVFRLPLGSVVDDEQFNSFTSSLLFEWGNATDQSCWCQWHFH